ncbi:MAG: SRPBCC family protein [Candidatus Eisenbacteria bacterium]
MRNVIRIALLLIAVFLMVIVTRPAQYHVERTNTIAAPAALIQTHIEDFHLWKSWSPWEHLDPAMKTEFSGAPSGLGASYYWSGNDKAGEGRMTVIESVPASKVGIKLEFLKPFKSTNACAFTLAPQGDATTVVWTMDGNHDFMGKAMSLFMNMDKMIGPDFEKGLASLKLVTEAQAAEPIPATNDSTAASP